MTRWSFRSRVVFENQERLHLVPSPRCRKDVVETELAHEGQLLVDVLLTQVADVEVAMVSAMVLRRVLTINIVIIE
jgi:hypothetical protein